MPNLCECILHESTAKIREQLARIDALTQKGSVVEAQKELKKVLAAQEQSIKLHVTEYRDKFARNMVEYAKVRALNIGEPLQTNGHTLGELKKMLEPPKKKSKKDKKPTLDGAIAVEKK